MREGALGSARAAELEIRSLVKRYTAQSVVGPLSFNVTAGAYLGQDLHLRVVSGEPVLTAVAQGTVSRHLAAGNEVQAAIAAADVFLLQK